MGEVFLRGNSFFYEKEIGGYGKSVKGNMISFNVSAYVCERCREGVLRAKKKPG